MKILISGGSGQLGHDVNRILSPEHTVVPLSSRDLDIGNLTAVRDMVNSQCPDIIVNCGAYTAVDNCEKEKEAAWKVNAEGPGNLARAMEENGGRLIHISTDYVFDGNKAVTDSYSEDDSVGPLSEYGRSKLAGEEAIQKNAPDHIILRTAWLYGMHGNNFLKTMLRLSLADPSRELKVVNDQHGSLTWTNSLARQINNVLSSEIQGIVHATATGSSTWYEGACYFLDAMKVPYTLAPCTTAEYPTPAHRPTNSILANRRLEQTGCSVFTSWQQDIDDFTDRYREELLLKLKAG